MGVSVKKVLGGQHSEGWVDNSMLGSIALQSVTLLFSISATGVIIIVTITTVIIIINNNNNRPNSCRRNRKYLKSLHGLFSLSRKLADGPR